MNELQNRTKSDKKKILGKSTFLTMMMMMMTTTTMKMKMIVVDICQTDLQLPI